MINGFNVFGIQIHFYGILIMLGAVFAAFMASSRTKKRGMDPELIWDMLPWLLIAGIIGARIWHILTPTASSLINGQNPYWIYPLDMLKIWNGGLGIPGAVMGGVLALYFYCCKHKLTFAVLLDIMAPGLALAQAVGRWGNFFNQEVYGLPSNLPWAIYIDPAHRLPGFENVERFHPTFFYEFLWNLLNMAVLLWVDKTFKDKLKPGDIFSLYLIIYPVGRFFLEFIRVDYSPIAGININQTLMAVIAVLSFASFFWRHRKPRKEHSEPITE